MVCFKEVFFMCAYRGGDYRGVRLYKHLKFFGGNFIDFFGGFGIGFRVTFVNNNKRVQYMWVSEALNENPRRPQISL